jgi:hypothetical protein
MPITEFKATVKPILAADLPYGHETAGDYERAAFFSIGHDAALAEMMRKAVSGEEIFVRQLAKPIAEPYSGRALENSASALTSRSRYAC